MRKLSAEQIGKIKTLYQKGKSERAIAKAVGCSRSAVWYQIKKANAERFSAAHKLER